MTRVLVLGGGVAGMLAASVLASRGAGVTVLERDRFAENPLPRKGIPQAKHAHLLLAGGARAIDELVPGTTRALVGAGGHRMAMPPVFSVFGWLPPADDSRYLISLTRGLLDLVLRTRVLRDSRIDVLDGTEVCGLTGDSRRVTGVRTRSGELGADLVIDTTGRTSRSPRWLAELGAPPVPEDVVDAGVGYATRLFRGDASSVYVQADPRTTGQSGVLLPVEGDRWIVSLAGMRGGVPPAEETAFLDFAAGLRHPALVRALEALDPIGPVVGFREISNRRRRFEVLRNLPEGFVAMGDAVCALNPTHGHGMSVAAFGALALRDVLRGHGFRPGLERRISRAVARSAAGAWRVVSGHDIQYRHTIGTRPGRAGRLRQRYTDRLLRAAPGSPRVAHAVLDVYTLARPAWRLLEPRVVFEACART